MIKRPTVDEYFTIMAMHASSRASCLRRRVGCILVDVEHHTLATGYNGPPSGTPNCFDEPCPAAFAPSGTRLTECRAVHAEKNALLRCPNIFKIDTAYVTAQPCINCIEDLLKTSCRRIVYLQEYPHPTVKIMWAEAGRQMDWIFDLIDDESPVHDFANFYGFKGASK